MVPAEGRSGPGAPGGSSGPYPGPGLRLAAAYAWRLIVVGAALYVLLRILGDLLTVVIPFSLALLLTALLRPIMVALRRRGLPRGLATIAAVLVAVVVLGGILALVVTRAVEQAPQLGAEIDRLIPQVKNWLISGPLHLDRATIDNFSKNLTSQVDKNTSAIASTALSTGKTVVDVLTGIVIVVFTTIFLLYDGERIWAFVTGVAPGAARPALDRAGRAAWTTLGHYVRGTLIVAVFHGVAIAVVLSILGVPLVAPLALLVALGSFIPLVGAVVTGAVAAGVAGVSQGLVAALVVVAVLVIDNQVEAHLLQPFVVGRYVRIHPLAIVLTLTAGTILLGIYGALIAVPLTACLNSGIRSLRAGAVVDGPGASVATPTAGGPVGPDPPGGAGPAAG